MKIGVNMDRIMINLGSSTLQQFNNSKFYGKKFLFSDYTTIICYQPLIQLIEFCKKTYLNVDNLQFNNYAVSDFIGNSTYKFYQNQHFGLRLDRLNIYQQVVGTEGTIQPDNEQEFLVTSQATYRTIQTISIQQVLIRAKLSFDTFNVLKIDIQGSQYPIFQWLLENDKLKLFNQVYVQFHSRLMKDKKRCFKIQKLTKQYCIAHNIQLVLQ